MSSGDFPGYFGRNLALYVLWIFLWGIPTIAVSEQFARDDPPPIVAAPLFLLIGLSFAGLVFIPQLLVLLVYLGVVWVNPARLKRAVAVALSPLTACFAFLAIENFMEGIAVVAAAATYGASLWLPMGAWWQRRPLAIAGAAAWVAIVAAIAFVQPLSAGIESDVRVTVRDGERVARYRLTCEYDRAGRLREAGAATTHPGGKQACDLLDEIYEGQVNGPPVLQDGCPRGAPVATFRGVIRDRRVDLDVIRGPCMEDWFAWDQAGALVPRLG